MKLPAIESKLKKLYQEMYELTITECVKCRAPLSCCSRDYCAITKEYAMDEWGVDLAEITMENNPKNLLFMSSRGCTVAPHLRPFCTLHTCDISGYGFLRDKDKNDRYFALREKINKYEFLRMSLS